MNKFLALSETFANFRNMMRHQQLQEEISFQKFVLQKGKTYKAWQLWDAPGAVAELNVMQALLLQKR